MRHNGVDHPQLAKPTMGASSVSTKNGIAQHVLFIVENCSVPQDFRVWRQALAVKKWGYEVSVISRKEGLSKSSYENIKGIDIYRHYVPPDLPSKFSYILEYTVSFLLEFTLAIRLYMKKPFHIIHAANPPDNIILIGAFFKLFGVKFIFDIHDLSLELYSSLYGKKYGMFWKALVFLEKLSCKMADIVITTNQSYQDVIRDRHNIDHSRLFVVRNDSQVDDFLPSGSMNIQQFKKEKIVLFVGAINYQDGVVDLIKALHFLVNGLNEKNFVCVIIGSGNAIHEVEKTIIDSNLKDYVDLKGKIFDRYLIRQYLNLADVCVEPAPYNEINNISTFIKILEYMATGKPIVAFDLKESKFSANGCTIFVQPGDTEEFAKGIKRLLNDPELRIKLGLIGRDRVKNDLNWDNSLKNLEEAYRTISV